MVKVFLFNTVSSPKILCVVISIVKDFSSALYVVHILDDDFLFGNDVMVVAVVKSIDVLFFVILAIVQYDVGFFRYL